jgi:hypothetical protein
MHWVRTVLLDQRLNSHVPRQVSWVGSSIEDSFCRFHDDDVHTIGRVVGIPRRNACCKSSQGLVFDRPLLCGSGARHRIGLSVEGPQLVGRAKTDSLGLWRPVQRRGATGTGALFTCLTGRGIFDGATDAAYGWEQ